jgi:hypothetical protein
MPAHLLGVNVRCMLGWCRLAIARAYSFGLYINDDALVGAVQASEAAAKERQQAADAVSGSPTQSLHTDSKAAPDSLSQVLDWLTTRHLQHAASERDAVAGPAAATTATSSAVTTTRGSTAAEGSAPELSLVLVMARDINGEHLAHGFKNSIINRLPGVEKRLRPAAGSSTSTSTSGSAAAAESTGLTLPDAAALKAAALASGRASLERDLDAERLPLLSPSDAAVSAATGAATSAAAGASAAPSAAPPAATPLAQVHAFAAAFNGLTFREGEEIVFTWQPAQGRVVTAFRQAPPSHQQQHQQQTQQQQAAPAGAAAAAAPPAALPPVPPSRDLQTRVVDAAALASPLLARTLFEVYCGAASSNPVSWRAKATFEANWGAIADPHNGILVVDEQSEAALPHAQAGVSGRVCVSTAAAAAAAAAEADGSAPSERASELFSHLRGWAKRTLAGDGIPSAAAPSAGPAAGALPGRAAAVAAPPPALEFSPCLAVREELLAAAVRREHAARSK